ncbi:SRPBCC family protein [Sphingobacterium sp. ML3W]|uniref:SRPBCC family protein n=1 Tax=Sphingobacterium sp. ML3W TaxID=1538644 RepID=UPI00249AD6A0|nr:SRPBCC family protein [Sphingobacterium sp. ML3W]WFA81128.1 SRPBCC family protein [Sphingobacterium sp. ML3W]
MKIVKKILIVLVILIAIPLIVALFVPKDFDAKSEITIDKPKQEVFNYVKMLRNQDYFGVWQLSDPQMKKSEQGTDGQVGFKYSWDGEKVGKGSQTITRIVDGETIETSLDFGFGEPSKGYFKLKEISSNQTAVTWGITGKSPYPWNLMSLFMNMDKDFDQGLKNLKDVLK